MVNKLDAENRIKSINKDLFIQWDDDDNITGTVWHKGVEYAGNVTLTQKDVLINLLRKFEPDETNNSDPRRSMPRR